MRLGTITIRLVALILLLVSVSDYWAFDQWDATAPMNASGPEAMEVMASQKAQTARLHSAALPDDHCLCCSPVVAPARAASSATQLLLTSASGGLLDPIGSIDDMRLPPFSSILPTSLFRSTTARIALTNTPCFEVHDRHAQHVCLAA